MKTRQVLWKLIRYRPWLYAADIAAWIVILLLELGVGYVAKLFFDSLAGASPAGLTMWSILALVLGVGMARVISILIGALFDIRHRFSMETLMRRNLLAGVLARPGADATSGPTGEALNTFRDDVLIVTDLLSWLIDQTSFVSYAIVALVILIRIDARVTAITVIPLLGVVLAARAVSKHIRRFREASRKATERVTGAIGEAMEGVQTVQLAGAQEHVTAHIKELNRERLRTTIRDRLLSQSFHSFFWNAATLCTGLILLAAAEGLRAGTFTVGDFAVFVIYVGVLTEAVAATGDFMIHFKQAGVSLDRMHRLIRDPRGERTFAHVPIYLSGELPPIPQPRLGRGERLQRLCVDGLCYQRPDCETDGSERFELRDASFTVERGEVVVITGRIGSGKTTLLRAMLGLLPATGGSVTWNGSRIADPSAFLIPPRCAYTPQVPQLFSASLRDNILMGLDGDAGKLIDAVRLAVLESDIPQLHDGMETIVGAKGVKLSGGQRQRVAAARMFIREPELLVFDDLSSALDVETERLLWDRIFESSDRTCLVVSHRRPALRRADRIVVMRNGAIEDIGRLDELLKRSEEMRSLWCSQESAAAAALTGT